MHKFAGRKEAAFVQLSRLFNWQDYFSICNIVQFFILENIHVVILYLEIITLFTNSAVA